MSNINQKTDREIARSYLKGKEPIRHINGSLFNKEEAKNLPRKAVCETHGEFEIKFAESPFAGKVFVNSVCSKCIDEFDKLVDEKEKEITEEKRKAKIKQRENDKLDYLYSRGVSRRYIDKSFDNYIADNDAKRHALNKSKALCDAIINNEDSFNLIMVGGVGTGKTHLANSMVKYLYDENKYSERINLIDLIRSLKSTWAKDNEQTEIGLINYYIKQDLLIIDEVGIQFGSDTEKMFIFDIIDGRYENCLPTVIISNLDINGVKDIIGERCVDRLREDGGKVIAFDWVSQR